MKSKPCSQIAGILIVVLPQQCSFDEDTITALSCALKDKLRLAIQKWNRPTVPALQYFRLLLTRHDTKSGPLLFETHSPAGEGITLRAHPLYTLL